MHKIYARTGALPSVFNCPRTKWSVTMVSSLRRYRFYLAHVKCIHVGCKSRSQVQGDIKPATDTRLSEQVYLYLIHLRGQPYNLSCSITKLIVKFSSEHKPKKRERQITRHLFNHLRKVSISSDNSESPWSINRPSLISLKAQDTITSQCNYTLTTFRIEIISTSLLCTLIPRHLFGNPFHAWRLTTSWLFVYS